MSRTKDFAERELDILVKSNPDPNNRPIIEEFIPELLALAEKFGKSGQSGGSAPYTAGALSQAVKHLCLQQPICPVTGIDEEWVDVAHISDGDKDTMYQNNRCHALFKDSTGRSWYLDAIVWKGDTVGPSGDTGWDTFTGTVEGITSRQFIKSFPFEPKTFYIDVHREKYDVKKHGENARVITTGLDGDVVYLIKDKSQLDKVFEYYEKQ